MKVMKLTTNKGKVFDWFLNIYINLVLWSKGINDVDRTSEETAKIIIKLKKLIEKRNNL